MHKIEHIEEWKSKLPNLAKAMIQENIKEASKVVRDFRTCDDFVCMNYQLYDADHGDNSLELAGYWSECYNFLKAYSPHLLPKKHGF